MQKEYGKVSYGGRDFFRRIVIIACVLLGITVLAYLYLGVVAPIISRIWGPRPKIYENLEYYTNRKYLQFENGSTFDEFIDTLDIVEQGDVINFYYQDNYGQDNLIYGKRSDIYSIDIQLDRQTYEDKKHIYSLDEEYCCDYGDYVLYFLPLGTESDIQTIIAFNEEATIIRCVMITEMSAVRFNSDISRFLVNQTTLDFGGDGSISYNKTGDSSSGRRDGSVVPSQENEINLN